MEKDKKKKATKKKNKDETLLERGIKLKKEQLDNENKTLLEAFIEKQKKQEKDDNWFEEKLRKLREDTRELFLTEEEYAKKYLTKDQSKSQIIGAKEYIQKAPDEMKVYSHYARKYGIPYVKDKHKKTLADLVRDIHTYEMKHRDEIIRKKVLDPVTKTYGLYIV